LQVGDGWLESRYYRGVDPQRRDYQFTFDKELGRDGG
jgi:hypothetical protein